ncbi:MAG: metallophosphoesterase family protein [Verrucomicrobiales bacterium]|nr:metallophosphoesterase [Verrucomicrobiales bacterium]
MKFAIFGDIHANLEALNAVLEDANENDCSHFVCIGDIVGYNANPKECLVAVKGLDCPVVKGNHDEMVASDIELVGLNPLAEQSMTWTRENLTQEDKTYLINLKLVRQVRDFTIVHATLDSPEGWGYVTSKFHALESFGYQYTPVCFIGHTHVPAFYIKTSSVEELGGRVLDMENGKKYLINVGSVGQPRDGDPRASYCIYDLGGQRILNRRVEYDIKSAQRKIIDAGLPDKLADRLSHGK